MTQWHTLVCRTLVLSSVISLGSMVTGAIAAYGLDALTVWQRLPNSPELSLLDTDTPPDAPHVLTSATIFQDDLTAPSLWWVRDQHGRKLLSDWIAYTGEDGTPRRVDLVVNRAAWQSPTLTYIDRYAFVLYFGRAAQAFGYQLRLFSRTAGGTSLLAAYLCEPESEPEMEEEVSPGSFTPSSCGLFIDPATGFDRFTPINPFAVP
ncbi:MAG: hypothetical protein EA367_15770 [Leptolyngbya sp. DLM2.Bin15]|nr:MAG: hypothetical protein EA367_15770 [Leptolyngbya sp. DLM2.Bin15]